MDGGSSRDGSTTISLSEHGEGSPIEVPNEIYHYININSVCSDVAILELRTVFSLLLDSFD